MARLNQRACGYCMKERGCSKRSEMKKIIIISIALLALTACGPKNESEYELHKFETLDIPDIEIIYLQKEKRRTYPPYRERIHLQKGWKWKNYWHRVRSNPQRRRKHP